MPHRSKVYFELAEAGDPRNVQQKKSSSRSFLARATVPFDALGDVRVTVRKSHFSLLSAGADPEVNLGRIVSFELPSSALRLFLLRLG